jgi:P pilus assembly chaperone PapD
MKTLRILAVALGLASAAIATAPASHAFTASPMLVELSPAGSGTERSVRITNNEDRPVAVEAEVYARSQSVSADEIAKTPSPDFIVLPPQVVVPAKSTQIVRIRWVGAGEFPAELAFRLKVSAVPYQDNGGNAGVDVAGAFLISVYITPPGAKSNLSVVSASKSSEKGGQIEFEVTNSGNKRATVIGGSFKIQSGGKTFEIDRETARQSMSTATILAGSTRKLTIKAPAGMPDGAASVVWEPEYLVE